MTASRRDQLRASELSTPQDMARDLNDVLLRLQQRVEQLERRKFVELAITTDAGGTMSPATVAAPNWEVKGVYLARAWDASLKIPATYVRIGWQRDGGVITVGMWIGDVSPSTRYELTLEMRG